jgi:archaea-specific DNA-binding protein
MIPHERRQPRPERSREPRPERSALVADREPKDPNTIYVGKKPVMAYVLAAVTQFNTGTPEVRLKARGANIARAVDANQILKNRFIRTLVNKKIDLATVELQREDGSSSKVSSIEITMSK